MDVIKEIDYWIEQAESDLHCFNPNGGKEQVKKLVISLYVQGFLHWYHLENKGILAYVIIPDYTGDLCVNELFMYIKPEYRGSIKLFRELVNHLEAAAIINNCKTVRMGSNTGFKDEQLLRVLQHFGYKTDLVVKYMR